MGRNVPEEVINRRSVLGLRILRGSTHPDPEFPVFSHYQNSSSGFLKGSFSISSSYFSSSGRPGPIGSLLECYSLL